MRTYLKNLYRGIPSNSFSNHSMRSHSLCVTIVCHLFSPRFHLITLDYENTSLQFHGIKNTMGSLNNLHKVITKVHSLKQFTLINWISYVSDSLNDTFHLSDDIHVEVPIQCYKNHYKNPISHTHIPSWCRN